MYRFFVRSPIAKLLWGILASLVGIILLLLVLVSENVRMAAQTVNWEGRSIENGATLFDNNCATCHGPDGRGLPGVAPALNSHYFFTDTGRLADIEWTGSLKDYVALTVAAGRPSKPNSQWAQLMPTWGSQFGGPFRGDQVEDVTAYILNWRDSALGQSHEDDPFQAFQDVRNPVEFQNIAFLVLSTEEQEAAREELKAQEAAVSGPTTPQELWISQGCSGCHNINEREVDVRGLIGPNMADLHERAGSQVPGQTAEEYVYESIINPRAFVVPTYEALASTMPDTFAERLSEAEIQGLVQWILDPNRQQ